MKSPEQEADDLLFRMKLYRAVKEGAAFLRARLEAREGIWFPGEGVPRRRADDPQLRL